MKTSSLIYTCLILIALSFLAACSALEREIELDLPIYERKLAVECYLKPGKKYKVAVSESVNYFDSPELSIVQDATGYIAVGGDTIPLSLNPILFDIEANKLYNYFSNKLVPINYVDSFYLHISDTSGRTATASTKMLPPVPIDTIKTVFNDEETLARLDIEFTDPPNVENFYRFQLARLNVGEPPKEEEEEEFVQDSNIQQDFFLDDELLDGERIPLGTGFDFQKGDTLVVTLFHIDKAYNDFYSSAEDALNASFNPFGQPTTIKTNMRGNQATGIFTFLIADRDTIVIP